MTQSLLQEFKSLDLVFRIISDSKTEFKWNSQYDKRLNTGPEVTRVN